MMTVAEALNKVIKLEDPSEEFSVEQAEYVININPELVIAWLCSVVLRYNKANEKKED